MQNSRSGQAKAVLSEVQTRHDDIKRIQRTIMVRNYSLSTIQERKREKKTKHFHVC